MATSKALRAAPARILDNYVASIKRLNGQQPSAIADASFVTSNYLSDGSSTTPTASSANLSIGFDFTVNGVTYTQFTLSGYGWMFLQQPSTVAASTDVMTATNDNTKILSTFSKNHVLITPWYDNASAIPAYADVLASSAEYNVAITSAILSDIKAGRNTKNWPYSAVDRGARYKNYYDAKNGKALAIRWTMSQPNFNHKLKFGVTLFENGLIEFRYWPLETFEPGNTPNTASTATAGIFWNGTGTANKFRDFAPLLSYRSANIQFGGAVYDSTYSESAVPYSNLLSTTYWPIGGGVISFAPPVNSMRLLPKKMIGDISNTREIVRSPGMFDDRKSIPYVSGGFVHMPSTLPSRLVGDTGDVNVSLLQLLFVSGSASGSLHIASNGRINKVAINKQLSQLEALDKMTARFDRSFNESQKNYSSSSFYTTGSSVDLFGEGFSSPLSSKTQFYFSLPVLKQTFMPATTSSFYYYDSNLRQWTMPAVNFYSASLKTRSVWSSSTFDDYDSIGRNTYRIIESAVGFDAVGRKVVSGTFAGGGSTSQQSDVSIGGFFNAPASRLIGSTPIDYVEKDVNSQSDAITKKYGNTFTDNINFFPSGSLSFNFPIDYPFLIEKVVVDIPFYISGAWFNDITTCNRAFGANGQAQGLTSGAIDFGGPGITFSLLCGRKILNSSYLDIIASGTITHVNDNTGSIILYKNTGMNNYMLRPVGFKAFSYPTVVVSGSGNIFDGKVRLEMAASVAGGLTLARNDRSVSSGTVGGTDYSLSVNRPKCVQLLTNPTLIAAGEDIFNAYDMIPSTPASYTSKSTRIYLQQISPLSRGTTGVEFNGNSILGGNIAAYNQEYLVVNPLYYSTSASLPTEFKNKIDATNFAFEAVSVYSLVDSKPSPYLMLPGDKLSISLSKTRPVTYKMYASTVGVNRSDYNYYELTGSHDTVVLNTGSIDITVYGSYVREGMEYNP